jgi:hypothetical protein
VLLFVAERGPAQAQVSYQRPQLGPSNRPTISPYLNLARGGNTAINYYGVVRPQQETARSLQNIQQQLQFGQSTPPASEEAGSTRFLTGHPTQFGNLGHYFPNTQSRQAAPSATGLGRPSR